jgi:GAF domain-containing protein
MTFATRHGQRTNATSSIWQVENRSRFAALIEYANVSDTSKYGRFMHKVMSETAPIWIENLAAIPRGRRIDLANAAGLRSAFAFPVVVQGELAAVLEFYADDIRAPDALLIENIVNITGQLARVIERARASEVPQSSSFRRTRS